MSKIPEEKMILLLKRGDWSAFNTIFNNFYIQLYFYCRKYIPNPEEAKDLLQNVFLRLWEKREEIEIKVSLKAYLYRSVQNECLNYIRSSRLNLSLSEIEGESILPNTSDPFSPDTDTENREIENLVDSIVETLPEHCRKIFIMSRINGIKNKDIAQQLSISVRTVDTQIYRALKIMKKGLKDYLSAE
ncbi:MAG: RNA polymerase sigma-70 factor [Massilibacteroides sp.]|nr:RNA polymerase sigma-70 factor [Massilibacteroides sp.]MDD3063569.1 RNA polymerase sigma-70 factor [Massilibacteroides sp.]MDD4114242.1 RNA polymerase sigma-70 factor [Massilibacteroides sp.]MDD4660994.1 RNA polymerase sigma-70 factor [Massilibacteroides sp.]